MLNALNWNMGFNMIHKIIQANVILKAWKNAEDCKAKQIMVSYAKRLI